MSKSAASRRFVALSTEKLDAFMNSDLFKLDFLVIQIDGLHVSDNLCYNKPDNFTCFLHL